MAFYPGGRGGGAPEWEVVGKASENGNMHFAHKSDFALLEPPAFPFCPPNTSEFT